MNNFTYFYLGSNSCLGFFSLFDKFIDEDTVESLYIIKGGPGCGKSSFMRSIASALRDEGLDIEYIVCSADVESLDGIYIPALKTAYLDGTAPHVLEPKYAGIRGSYVNMGIYYDSPSLLGHLDEIEDLTISYKNSYKRAYSCLEAAEKYQKGIYDGLFTEKTYTTIARRADGIIARELKKTGRPRGKAKYRFLSAICSSGYVCRYDTAMSICSSIYVLDNNYGLARLILEPVCEAALERGYDVIVCPSPFEPNIIEHIIIPELSLGFVSNVKEYPFESGQYKHIRLDSLIDKEYLRKKRGLYRSKIGLRNALMDNAFDHFRLAKETHDDIEDIYNPSVDFGGVYALAEAHAKSLLSSLNR